MKIYYDTPGENGIHFDINNYVKYRHKPEWWTSLTPFLFGAKTFKESMAKSWDLMFKNVNPRLPTSKTCPALNVYFSKTLPLKINDDVLIETTAQGGYRWVSADRNIQFELHMGPEAPGYLSQNFIFIKFLFEFYITTDKACDISFTDAVLYNDLPYKVCPGIIQHKKKAIQKINLITLFPKVDAKYHFPRDTIVGCVQFSEKITGLEHKPMLEDIKKHVYNISIRNNNQKYFKDE